MKRNDSLLHICKKNKRKIAGWRRHKETGGHDFLLYRRDRAKIFALTGSDLQNSLLFFTRSFADTLGTDSPLLRTAMRYFRVFWIDRNGIEQRSDPLTTWLDAMNYRAELIISGAVSAPCAAHLVRY